MTASTPFSGIIWTGVNIPMSLKLIPVSWKTYEIQTTTAIKKSSETTQSLILRIFNMYLVYGSQLLWFLLIMKAAESREGVISGEAQQITEDGKGGRENAGFWLSGKCPTGQGCWGSSQG